MCWIAVLKPNQQLNPKYLATAAAINKDGFGVMYYKDNKVQSFKTMDFTEFKAFIEPLQEYARVIHLRYTSIGKTTLDNSHPFEVGNDAWMCHNGSMTSMKTVACTTTCEDNSDTRNLSEVIKLCKWEKISDVLPLVHQITGKAGNKLVFMEADGTVTIVNKSLGNEEDGIWYSNTYHVETKKYDYSNSYSNYYTRNYLPAKKNELTTKVFVYGTLKKGYSNHGFLTSSTFIGKATTVSPYAMIGEGKAFPYLLKIHPSMSGGKHVKGEIFEVTDTVLGRLDMLEGVPTHYKKQYINVKMGTETISCLTYVKTTITEYDMKQTFIDEFTSTNYYPPLESKTLDELAEMTIYQLVTYLADLEEEVYGKSYTTYKRYMQPKEELIDEISEILDFIDLDSPILSTSPLGYDEYLDD